MCGTGPPAGPPRGLSRRRFLEATGLAGLTSLGAGRTAGDEGGQSDRMHWRLDTGDWVTASPTAVGKTVYVGSPHETLYALEAGVSGSSVGTRIEQGVLGHHHSHVGGDEKSVDPTDCQVTRTPECGPATGDAGGFSSSGDDGPGFEIGAALVGIGADAAWTRRRRDRG